MEALVPFTEYDLPKGTPKLELSPFKGTFSSDGILQFKIDSSRSDLTRMKELAPIFQQAGVPPSKATMRELINIIGLENVVSVVSYQVQGSVPFCTGYSYQISYVIDPIQVGTREDRISTLVTGTVALEGELANQGTQTVMTLNDTALPARVGGFPRSADFRATIARNYEGLSMGGDLPPCDFMGRGGWSDVKLTVTVTVYFNIEPFCLKGSNMYTNDTCYNTFNNRQVRPELSSMDLREFCKRNGITTLHDLNQATDPRLKEVCGCALNSDEYLALRNQLVAHNPALASYSDYPACYYEGCRQSSFGTTARRCGDKPKCLRTGTIDITGETDRYSILGLPECAMYGGRTDGTEVEHAFQKTTGREDVPRDRRVPDTRDGTMPSRVPDTRDGTMPAPVPEVKEGRVRVPRERVQPVAVEPPAASVTIVNESAPPKKKGWSAWQIVILVVLIMLVLLALGGFVYAVTRPTKTQAILATSNI